MKENGKAEKAIIGVIGLDLYGGGIAICLSNKNHIVNVYDENKDSVNDLKGNFKVMRSPAEIARKSEILFVATLDSEEHSAGERIIEQISGKNGILEGAKPGLCIAIVTTISLNHLEEIRSLIGNHGINLIDCGVTGGPVSHKGEMVCMVGGEHHIVEIIMPYIKDFCEKAYHMGGPGSGMATKIARNLVHYTVWRAGYEGAKLAKAFGLNMERFIDIVSDASMKPGASVTMWMDPQRIEAAPRLEQDREGISRRVLMFHQKDMNAAKELSDLLNVSTPAADIAREFGSETYNVNSNSA